MENLICDNCGYTHPNGTVVEVSKYSTCPKCNIPMRKWTQEKEDYFKKYPTKEDAAFEELEKKLNTDAGLKYDEGKLLMSLVDPRYIEDVAGVLTFGAKKYKPNSWQTVEDAERRYTDALLRHTTAFLKGEYLDPESGLTHLSHMATNIMFLSHFERNKVRVLNDCTTSSSK